MRGSNCGKVMKGTVAKGTGGKVSKTIRRNRQWRRRRRWSKGTKCEGKEEVEEE